MVLGIRLIIAIALLISSPAFPFNPCSASLAAPSSLDVAPIPEPGVIDAVVVVFEKNGQLLMGLRQGGTGPNTWGFIGGKSDPGETIRQTAERESFEEIGIKAGNLEWIHAGYDYRPENRQVYRVFFLKGTIEGEPSIREPHKMMAMGWFEPAELPSPIFSSNRDLLASFVRQNQ